MYLIFGRGNFLSVTIFWRDVLSPRAYSYLIDYAMKYLFNWHSKNVSRADKDVIYSHLYSFTSVKLIVVSHCGNNGQSGAGWDGMGRETLYNLFIFCYH